MKLARAGAPAARVPSSPPPVPPSIRPPRPATAPPKPVSPAAMRVSAPPPPAMPPASDVASVVEPATGAGRPREAADEAVGQRQVRRADRWPPRCRRRRRPAGVLWSRKAKIDAQAAVDEVREREVLELKRLMEDGNRLLGAGSADQALEKFREVIRRKPDSVAARDGVARAEALLRSRLAGEERTREVADPARRGPRCRRARGVRKRSQRALGRPPPRARERRRARAPRIGQDCKGREGRRGKEGRGGARPQAETHSGPDAGPRGEARRSRWSLRSPPRRRRAAPGSGSPSRARRPRAT